MKLSKIQEELACKLKEFNQQLMLAKKILVKMQDETYNLIDPYYDDSTEFKQTFQGSKHHLPKRVRVLNFFLVTSYTTINELWLTHNNIVIK